MTECTTAPPRSLAELAPARLAQTVGVMTDIDDTLTRDGVIEAAAMGALQALANAGVPVVAITGRPLGWSQPFARDWPVAAIVAENGAVALLRDASMGSVTVEYAQDAATRERNAVRLREVARRIVDGIPGATLARDSAGRVTDIAIDHSEHARLPRERVDEAVALMRRAGMTATVSSIHVNGWFGNHDKWTGACWMVQRLWGRELADEIDRWIYVGDSPNDEPMFERFPLAVGVANLRRFADEIRVWPAFVTPQERGAGFAEVAGALLAARRPA